jgi:hypothetical protein
MDDDRARALLAERKARREKAEKQQRATAMAAVLRSLFYDKQAAFYSSAHRRKATTKTRRAGATTGGCSELLARALTLEGHRAEEGFRAAIIHSTRIEAKSRAWRNDTKSGIVDVLSKHGKKIPNKTAETYELGGVIVTVHKSELALDFDNGSRIDIYGCDSDDDLGKLRGNAKHVFWIDEAQDPKLVAILGSLYKDVIVPAAADYRAETWLTGTPGQDLAGMFYDVTRNEEDQRLQGWEVHALSVVDNPRFGATPEERWNETALRALTENKWTVEEPAFQREWLGKWVSSDARYVYAAHQVADHELLYAPQRLDLDGFPDIQAALRDLPGYVEGLEYFLALGGDLGTRDDFAFVVYAWSLRDPVLYEVCSWKKPGLDYDEMAAHLRAVCDQVHISIVVCDAGGGGKPAVMGWSKKWVERYGLPITEATKPNKAIAIKQKNNDIRHHWLKLRRGGPLHAEMMVHRWAPQRSATGKMVEDPSTPNHCCDASLYAHRDSYHHRYREEVLPPAPGSAEWAHAEERELEDAAISPEEDIILGGW